MKAKHLGALALLPCMLASVVHAAPHERYFVSGVGMHSCGTLLNNYKADPNGAQAAYTNWMAGFITGSNSLCPKQANFDWHGAEAFLRKWCADNPLKAVAAAAHVLRKETGGADDLEDCR